MNNKTKNKINTKTTKLFGILAISVIATLMISTSATQYAYATDAPKINSVVVDDPDDLDDVYFTDDIITIIFDSDTNTPGGTGPQTRTAVDDLFTFSESIGQAYNGQWSAPDTFIITINNVNNAGPPVIDITTVTPAGITPILSSDETSIASTFTSPVLSGDFGVPPFANPWTDGDAGVIHYTGGNVGIGITLPNNLLSVNGIIESTSGGFKFPDGSIQDTVGITAEADPIFDSSIVSSITQIDIDNWDNDQVDDADNDPTNEIETWSTLSGIPADIADGDDVGTGDITGVTAGTGLSGGGTTGSVTLNVDTSSIQNRVTGSCISGSSIRVISSSGTVTCESDSTGSGTYQAGTTSHVETGYVNDWDATFNYDCPSGKVITGVYAVHDNDKEDRRFKFTCSYIQTVVP